MGNDGTFSQEISGLKFASKYYAVVIANVDGVDVQSEVINFTTTDYSASFSSIGWETTEHTGTIKANITVESKEQMDISVWVLYSATATDAIALKANGTKISASPYANDEFRSSLTGLSAGMSYSFIVVANVGEKEIESQVLQFETQPIKVSAYLRLNATATERSLALNGKVISEMQEPLSNFTQTYKVYYSASETAAEAIIQTGNYQEVSLDQNNEFTVTFDNLASNQKYNCMVQSVIDGISVLGEIQQYSTAQVNASVSTNDAQEVDYTKAYLSGSFSVNSLAELSTEPYFIYCATASTLNDIIANGTQAMATASGNVFSSQLINIQDGVTFHFVACVKVHDTVIYGEVKSFTTKAIPEGGVDLGLSVLWHRQNVGASSPEGYGNYYAWGETSTKEKYSLDTYKWCYVEGNYRYSKYNSWSSWGMVDNKKELDIEDDAAHVVLGNGWRTPSYEEMKELLANCSWEWTSINGIKGGLFTSKMTGNSIFLPAAGRISDVEHVDKNISGMYMSSTLGDNYPDAEHVLWFSSLRIEPNPLSVRQVGISVRAVHE